MRLPRTFRSWLFPIVLLLVFSESAAWGYRPFIATDAAVADPKEIEIELGYFNLERDKGKNTFIIPRSCSTTGSFAILNSWGNLALKNLRTVQFGFRILRYR